MSTSVMQRSRSHTAAKAYKKSVLPRWPHGNKAPIPRISADQFGPGHGKAHFLYHITEKLKNKCRFCT